VNQITDLARRVKSAGLRQRLYAGYCIALFTVMAATALVLGLFLPALRARRQVAGVFSRGFFRAAGIPLRVQGIEHLPRAPCVVVANHASYIDGIVAVAALPPEFAFVIKKEMVRVPLASLLLRRLGSQFVERFDRHKGASDARRVWKLAATGQSLVFFPEGTFDATRQIGKFLGGAFATAERSQMHIVAVAIHGTREVLPSGSVMLRRKPIRFEILAVLHPEGARQRSRELIAQAVGEPLAP
jgi:1-acyl-sn-glycerol-3-phosphate acyltransferase